jgi:hypothetical protein
MLRRVSYANKISIYVTPCMSWPGGGRGLSPSTAPEFESSCARLLPPRCLTCPLGLQGVQWAVGLVVVRANWPGHPRKSKKKKKDMRISSSKNCSCKT